MSTKDIGTNSPDLGRPVKQDAQAKEAARLILHQPSGWPSRAKGKFMYDWKVTKERTKGYYWQDSQGEYRYVPSGSVILIWRKDWTGEYRFYWSCAKKQDYEFWKDYLQLTKVNCYGLI